MGNTEAERMMTGLLQLYHEYAQDLGAMDKAGLSKMMQENFPTFLSACERKSPDFLEKFFQKEDVNHDEKISFPEFLSSVATVAMDMYPESQGQKPCSEG
ncbi:protein S100-A7 [Marmota marmota marmota]|uniref:EF-hand domain-containing protein n=1 Tax=Marmota marmota marmota TaxID=9994 RepID=A0A8C5ZWK6_MARMA|nr:protein S100-A7 [Marmota marmota marmota]